jgi:hypothetical protein
MGHRFIIAQKTFLVIDLGCVFGMCGSSRKEKVFWTFQIRKAADQSIVPFKVEMYTKFWDRD